MTLDTLIIFAGIFVAALPFLGFPSSWDTVLLFLAGIFIIGLGIALRRRGNSDESDKPTKTLMDDSLQGDHESR